MLHFPAPAKAALSLDPESIVVPGETKATTGEEAPETALFGPMLAELLQSAEPVLAAQTTTPDTVEAAIETGKSGKGGNILPPALPPAPAVALPPAVSELAGRAAPVSAPLHETVASPETPSPALPMASPRALLASLHAQTATPALHFVQAQQSLQASSLQIALPVGPAPVDAPTTPLATIANEAARPLAPQVAPMQPDEVATARQVAPRIPEPTAQAAIATTQGNPVEPAAPFLAEPLRPVTNSQETTAEPSASPAKDPAQTAPTAPAEAKPLVPTITTPVAANPTAPTAPAAAPYSPSTDATTVQSIEALVETVAQARENATGPVRATLSHAEFGLVGLALKHEDSELVASLSSADPAFARAVQAGLSARTGQDQTPTQQDTSEHRSTDQGQPQHGNTSGTDTPAGNAGQGRARTAHFASSSPSAQSQSSQPDEPAQPRSAPSDLRRGILA